jgi:hypothetical protein
VGAPFAAFQPGTPTMRRSTGSGCVRRKVRHVAGNASLLFDLPGRYDYE